MKKKLVQVKWRFKKNLVVVLGLLLFFCVAGALQAAQQPQSLRLFQEVEGSNGSIIRDSKTGLEWQRCAYGQSWTGSGCSGAAWKGTWHDAVWITAPGGFRVPTIDELTSLAPYDQNVFPGAYWLWSSSLYPADNYYALGLYFGSGGVNFYTKHTDGQVRLVRGGQ